VSLGQPDALLPLGQCYEYGLGCGKPEPELAFELTEKSAKDDHPSGQFRIGQYYQRGYGCEKNEEEAKKWFARASKAGHPYAKEFLNLK
jgi:TPR repeat protein